MNRLYKQKRKFIEEQFRPVLFAADVSVRTIKYYKRSPDSPEIITITFQDGAVKHIDVTGDSYNAMMRDVLAQLD